MGSNSMCKYTANINKKDVKPAALAIHCDLTSIFPDSFLRKLLFRMIQAILMTRNQSNLHVC